MRDNDNVMCKFVLQFQRILSGFSNAFVYVIVFASTNTINTRLHTTCFVVAVVAITCCRHLCAYQFVRTPLFLLSTSLYFICFLILANRGDRSPHIIFMVHVKWRRMSCWLFVLFQFCFNVKLTGKLCARFESFLFVAIAYSCATAANLFRDGKRYRRRKAHNTKHVWLDCVFLHFCFFFFGL